MPNGGGFGKHWKKSMMNKQNESRRSDWYCFSTETITRESNPAHLCPVCGYLWCVPACPLYDERYDPMLADCDNGV